VQKKLGREEKELVEKMKYRDDLCNHQIDRKSLKMKPKTIKELFGLDI
jgi:hypothetical protein